MDKPEDILYLKQFVKQHPDNKMGWYLLGKHYREAGKEGKANYCFIQAGDIYDAFEQESHPLALRQQQLEQLKEWEKKQNKRRMLRKIAAAAIPLLLLALLVPSNGQIGPNKPEETAVAPAEREPGIGVLFVPQKEMEPIGHALDAFVSGGGVAPSFMIAARLEEKDGWQQWNGRARFVMTVNRLTLGSQLEVSMLDRETCICEPTDATEVSKLFMEWKAEQETHWTLASAIHHYEGLFGKWPERLDDLIRPYPNNILSGEGEGMSEIFHDVLRKVKEKQADERAGGNGAWTGAGSSAAAHARRAAVGTNGLYERQWSKPLEIVVDVSNYRLAVIHNSKILRSYEVGLGGEKTPEGGFFISEKVRDPNGSDDGIFGSRGMTLSNTLYAIHGTNEPDSIGKDESLGCIRMKDDDLKELYDMVPLGTKVSIKNGTLPSDMKAPSERFRLEPKQNERNPGKTYQWLT